LRATRSVAADSDRRRDLLQPDQAGERAHFLLLIFTQLKQQRHRSRFQLLDFFGIGIDRRHAGRFRIALPRRVDLAGDGAQRGFNCRPVAGIATGAADFGASMSEGAVAAKAIRSGSLRLAVCGGSKDASANFATASRSCLLSRLATGLLTTGADSSNRAAGTLSRPKMLAAVAPTIRKQVSAMMVMAFVKQLSTSPGHSLSPKLGNN
jgi:hypothetical protein